MVWSSGFDSGFGDGRQPALRKSLVAHVYDADGNAKGVWSDLAAQPTYSWRINSGPSSMRLSLARRQGEAGEPGEWSGMAASLDLGYNVKLYVMDEESGANGVLIYQGEVQEYSFDLQGQMTEVLLVPVTSKPFTSWIADEITLTDYDPTNMMRYWVDQGYLAGVTWDATSSLVGKTFTQTFKRQTVDSAMQIIRRLAGSTWFWRFNPDNSLTFDTWGEIPVADHVFKLGVSVASARLSKSKVGQVKRVFVYGADIKDANGIVIGQVSASDSSPGYDPADGAQDETITNSRITEGQTAKQLAIATRRLKEKTSQQSEITVPDCNWEPGKGYDIESIQPGEVGQLLNPEYVYEVSIVGVFEVGVGLVSGVAAAASQRAIPVAEVRYSLGQVALVMQQRPIAVTEAVADLGRRMQLTEVA